MPRSLIARLAVLLALGCSSGLATAGAWEDILKAANENDTEAVVGLVARGMDVNTSDQTGTTLLMIAARNGNEPLLEFLLNNRANALKRNRFGDTAVLLATMSGQLGIVKRLIEYGVPLAGRGWLPLHYAAFSGQIDIARYLLAKGAPIDARAPNGQTALMLAVREGQFAIAKLLVEMGADISAKDGEGTSALDIAVSHGNTAIAELLGKPSE